MKPPQNATEVQVPGVFYLICDGCNHTSPAKKALYVWDIDDRPPQSLPTKVRQRDIRLCLSCQFAYGGTLVGKGYKLQP